MYAPAGVRECCTKDSANTSRMSFGAPARLGVRAGAMAYSTNFAYLEFYELRLGACERWPMFTSSYGIVTMFTTLRWGARGGVGTMARAGERLYDPVQGDSIEFRETARDTGGALLSGVWTAVGDTPLHVHPLQEEHFEVLSGTVGIQIEDEHRSLGEGEQATVPSGTPHRWYSEDDQEEKARFLFELRPALNTEILLETLYGLATDGNTDKNGLPKPLQMAVILNG